MTLDDIPADKLLILTRLAEKLFRVAKCDPACHACLVDLSLGDEYQLLTHAGRVVMLCGKCTGADLTRKQAAEKRRLRAYGKLHPGFSRPSRPSPTDLGTCTLCRAKLSHDVWRVGCARAGCPLAQTVELVGER